jgi:hypothetical protein
MLPTSTLNPTATSAAAGKPTNKSRVKRASEIHSGEHGISLDRLTTLTTDELFNADRWWWAGIGLTIIGTALYMYPSS